MKWSGAVRALGGLRLQQCVWPRGSRSEADGRHVAAFSVSYLAIFNFTTPPIPCHYVFATFSHDVFAEPCHGCG